MTAGTGGRANVPVSVVELMDTRKHGTHEAQGLGGDAFRCDFIRSQLSHSHSDERERKKERGKPTEVENAEYCSSRQKNEGCVKKGAQGGWVGGGANGP